jgi:hypothetical protein
MRRLSDVPEGLETAEVCKFFKQLFMAVGVGLPPLPGINTLHGEGGGIRNRGTATLPMIYSRPPKFSIKT